MTTNILATTSDVARALDKQAKLEAEAADGPWVCDRYCNEMRGPDGQQVILDARGYVPFDSGPDGVLIAHLRNQAKLARAVIEVVSSPFFDPATDHKDHRRLRDALAAWADHVNGEDV